MECTAFAVDVLSRRVDRRAFDSVSPSWSFLANLALALSMCRNLKIYAAQAAAKLRKFVEYI
jgi:hypothetical protein